MDNSNDYDSDLGRIPAVKITRFLPESQRDALYAAVCTNQAALQRLGASGSDAGGSFILPLEPGGTDAPGVTPIRDASDFLIQGILQLLPSLFTALDIEPFAVSRVPMTLVNGLDGHCGLPHADSTDDRYRISLLYYFHRLPRAFRGGDLEFYTEDPEFAQGDSEKAIARIEQQDNLLIAFPSNTFHGITDVCCDSSDFADGRFAAVVFLGLEP
jgi:SM-20-related protein